MTSHVVTFSGFVTFRRGNLDVHAFMHADNEHMTTCNGHIFTISYMYSCMFHLWIVDLFRLGTYNVIAFFGIE